MNRPTCTHITWPHNHHATNYHSPDAEHFAFCKKGERLYICLMAVVAVATYFAWSLGVLPYDSPTNMVIEALSSRTLGGQWGLLGWMAAHIAAVSMLAIAAEVVHASWQRRGYNAGLKHIQSCLKHFAAGPNFRSVRESAEFNGLRIEIEPGNIQETLTIRRDATATDCALLITCDNPRDRQPTIGGRGNHECFTANDMEQTIRLIDQIVNRQNTRVI